LQRSNGSAKGWFIADRRNQKAAVKVTFYDEHVRSYGGAGADETQ
jgi:hypothetical protein